MRLKVQELQDCFSPECPNNSSHTYSKLIRKYQSFKSIYTRFTMIQFWSEKRIHHGLDIHYVLATAQWRIRYNLWPWGGMSNWVHGKTPLNYKILNVLECNWSALNFEIKIYKCSVKTEWVTGLDTTIHSIFFLTKGTSVLIGVGMYLEKTPHHPGYLPLGMAIWHKCKSWATSGSYWSTGQNFQKSYCFSNYKGGRGGGGGRGRRADTVGSCLLPFDFPLPSDCNVQSPSGGTVTIFAYEQERHRLAWPPKLKEGLNWTA